jgi:hypothetical protein
MKRQKKWFTVFVRLDMRGDRINYSNFSAFVKIGLER